MIKVKVRIVGELGEIINQHPQMFDINMFPLTEKAVHLMAKTIARHWQDYAIGKRGIDDVPSMKNPSEGYMKGIKIEQSGDFGYEIVNYSKAAEFLEYGTAEFDMKSKLDQYPRSRMTKGVRRKDGSWKIPPHPYLIVPFRWGTPKTVGFQNVMPVEIYNIVKRKKFDKSIVGQETHNEPNAKGEDVDRWNYDKWGSRLNIKQIIEADDVGMNINQIFNMTGMVRMDTSTKNQKYSGYYTFRVMSARSRPDSWIRPATPARNITKALEKQYQHTAEEAIEEAFNRDMRRIIK
jgi:hypothetical protein